MQGVPALGAEAGVLRVSAGPGAVGRGWAGFVGRPEAPLAPACS